MNGLPPKSQWTNKIIGVQILSNDHLRGSYAAVDVITGVMYINRQLWPRLSEDMQYFILCHEFCHLKYNTDNEFSVDNEAFKMYVKTGRSLRQMVQSLCLNMTEYEPSEEIVRRANALYNNALIFDKQHGKIK